MSRVSKRGLELLVLLDMRVYIYNARQPAFLPPSLSPSLSLSLFSHVYVRDPQLHVHVVDIAVHMRARVYTGVGVEVTSA